MVCVLRCGTPTVISVFLHGLRFAHTRAGHRLRGEVTAGEITVGAPAHLALWDAPELGVQAENDGRSSWSTDARSGTPLLPYLAQEGLVPTCLATWRSGELIYEAP